MPDHQEMMEKDQRELEVLKKAEGACHADLNKMRQKACGCAAEGGEKKGLFYKLKNYLAQIAGLQAKENDLLGRIETIENKHAEMKKRHLLHHPQKSVLTAPTSMEDDTPSRKRRAKGLWGLLAFLVFIADEDKKKKTGEPAPH